jgi:hypothetical protein
LEAVSSTIAERATSLGVGQAINQDATAIHDAKSADFILTGRSGVCFESRGTILQWTNCTGDSGQSRVFLSVSDRNACPSCTTYNAGRSQRSWNLYLPDHSSGSCLPATSSAVPSGSHLVRRADYRLGRNRSYKHRTVLHPQRGHDGLVCSWEVCLKLPRRYFCPMFFDPRAPSTLLLPPRSEATRVAGVTSSFHSRPGSECKRLFSTISVTESTVASSLKIRQQTLQCVRTGASAARACAPASSRPRLRRCASGCGR